MLVLYLPQALLYKPFLARVYSLTAMQTSNNVQKAASLGWLDDDGICRFPEDVKALVTGYHAIGIPIQRLAVMSSDELNVCVKKGLVRFVDGDGELYTYDQYISKYPDYPDPVWQLEQRGAWPPRYKRVFSI